MTSAYLEIGAILLVIGSGIFILRYGLKLRQAEIKLDDSQDFVPMGDALYNILDLACRTPNINLMTADQILSVLNKGQTVDAPYYGIGPEEFKMLVEGGYLRYWEPNIEEKRLPKYKKTLQATPKAFELVEARKNRLTSYLSMTASVAIGLIAILIMSFTVMLNVTGQNLQISLISAGVITASIAYMVVKNFNDDIDKLQSSQ